MEQRALAAGAAQPRRHDAGTGELRVAGSGDLLREVLAGMVRAQKSLPPKLFYDAAGSQLFEQICELPEYYPARTERSILQQHAGAMAALAGPHRTVIEPGAGSASKSLLLLRALAEPLAYVPIDVSGDALARGAASVRAALPALRVLPVTADFTAGLRGLVPRAAGHGGRLLFFPGSTIGNFDPADAQRLLAGWRVAAGAGALLLIGVDLRKDAATLQRAYDDAAGVTARFNLNLLRRLNRELGADFDLASFGHRAVVADDSARVEMHLVSLRPQRVRIAGRRFLLRAGETIHTENSWKYAPGEFAQLAGAAGWRGRDCWTDPQALFSVQAFEVMP